jgi:hypothetical protein
MQVQLGQQLLKTPWEWRPSHDNWFERLASSAAGWRPAESLKLTAGPLIDRIVGASRQRERWLIHPCISRLTTSRRQTDTVERDLQLAMWISRNSPMPEGSVTLPRPFWVWTSDGGRRYPADEVLLTDFSNSMTADASSEVALDLWCRSIGFTPGNGLCTTLTADTSMTRAAQSSVVTYCRAIQTLARRLPECNDWVSTSVRVAVPLLPKGTNSVSESSIEFPGAAFLSIHHEVQVMEALVHEAAHQHLLLAEVGDPLIDPQHSSLYPSPVRRDPRPLRGVLLAFHALAYIAALYSDLLESEGGVRNMQQLADELRSTRSQLHAARGTLESARHHITRFGHEFFEYTAQVVAYKEQLEAN